jgi:CheY-like chemotaxis protein
MAPVRVVRVFDTFFSTTGPDKGTGLGLATSLGFVKGDGGLIRVYSRLGRGTTFTVYLPAQLDAEYGAELPTELKVEFRGRGETILVVDDEAPVRDILHRVLTRLNFRVLMAADGTSALREISTHGADISLVITDLHMPHLGGVSFVRVLRNRLPDAGVIVASGLVNDVEREQLFHLGVKQLVAKPFTMEELVEALQALFAT